jgi:zinc transport system substrate-binding protein
MPATARFALACLFATAFSTASLAAPKVVATIKPIHSIAANVMAGIGEPDLLLDAAVSEHTAQLTPSQVRAMQNADLIVAVGENLEAFLHKALENPGDRPEEGLRGGRGAWRQGAACPRWRPVGAAFP